MFIFMRTIAYAALFIGLVLLYFRRACSHLPADSNPS